MVMKWLGLIIAGLIILPTVVTGENRYRVHIDLNNVNKDRLKIVMYPPSITRDEVQYQLPVVVPGTYDYTSYNIFIKRFRAYDERNKRLRVKSLDGRKFIIRNAKKLHKIEYWIEDTWDLKRPEDYIFHPGGTNIEEGKNFLINHFGYFGYIRGYKYFPFQLYIQKPESMHGSSSLKRLSGSTKEDIWYAKSYKRLIDHPIMYCTPDTLSFIKDTTRINISVYSTNNVVTAKRLEPIIRNVTDAVHSFFEGLPVPDYSFLFYFAGYQQDEIKKAQKYGALEHKNSSVYFLPEIYSDNNLEKVVQGIAIHEFLHILTPLRLRSDKLVYFNLLNPEMSEHLWLYEGVTEYFANWLMLTETLITEEEFITEMRRKILKSNFYQPVSFTEMSRYILEEPFKGMYDNIYERGAIIGFLLDIKINELTGSRLNLRSVVLDIAEKYGNTPFKDETFIEEFVSHVHPDLQGFFDKYVIGSDTLPVNQYFAKLGWDYTPNYEDTVYSFGELKFYFNPRKSTFNIGRTHPRSNLFGLKGGEQVVAINNRKLTPQNYSYLFEKVVNPSSREQVTLKVKTEAETLSMLAEPVPVKASQLHRIIPLENAGDHQQNLKERIFRLH